MPDTSERVVGIITAGGSGKRFGSQKPKQFLEIDGKPLLLHTLAAFEAAELIDAYVLVLPGEHRDFFPEGYRKRFSLTKLDQVINGGKTRQASVLNGLRAAREARLAVIHDGVRCLIHSTEIDRTIRAVDIHDGAILAERIRDTVKQVENQRILRTVPRKELWGMKTPQVFQFDLIRQAYEKCEELSIQVTDDAAAMEEMGSDLVVVESEHFNLKVTHSEDLDLAAAILKSRGKGK